MFRFAIRNVVWLTVVVAFALMWYIERDGRKTSREGTLRMGRENEQLMGRVKQLETDLIEARARHKRELSELLRVTN